MFCPVCRGQSTKVLDSRDSRDGGIRRRRQCLECGHRFTTRERVETTMPVVIKRSGTRQNFDRLKILSGLQIACRKRPITEDTLEEIVHAVELWAATRGDKEILAEEIGLRIMHHLYSTDQVAYVRFVSVYRSFDTASEFERLLVEMEKAEHVSVDGQRNLFEFDKAGRAVGVAPPEDRGAGAKKKPSSPRKRKRKTKTTTKTKTKTKTKASAPGAPAEDDVR